MYTHLAPVERHEFGGQGAPDDAARAEACRGDCGRSEDEPRGCAHHRAHHDLGTGKARVGARGGQNGEEG
jgi:hypothetical protein